MESGTAEARRYPFCSLGGQSSSAALPHQGAIVIEKLRRTVMRIGSLLLATGLQPTWGYIETSQNPADRPSRWAVKKRWLKQKR